MSPVVLLVEDDQYQSMLMARWLEEAGLPTAIASSSVEAVSFLNLASVMVLVSDVDLPDGNGLDLVKTARASKDWRGIAMVTALDRADVAVAALKFGADEFLVKPLQRDHFVSTVRDLVNRATDRRNQSRRLVLAVGAHPDDVEIGVGGTLARHVAAGDQVAVLTLTAGARGGDSGLRRQESEAAAVQLGASLHWGGFQDGAVSDGSEVIGFISEHVRRLKPQTVYVHALSDTHQDHRATHRAALVACRSINNVLCYQSPSTTTGFVPTRFVDVGPYLENKLSLIHAYQSQFSKCSYLADDLIRATARYWGRFAGYRDVEPLEVVRATDA